ncbi:DUF5686 and carboxypeptidase-like regulatory domain-containing protein [Lutibacter sp.]|uniref:DUF5686 and carboxypeptidase-like regulatory domain-containing protein n=1 Tax=Lutibacter sp. TaxID=1925666 RepID=UPI0027336320|nr:DUF5686 and carboxypeptidase-like regulatory domain-containing protein [Lutibacter sp.]MDP3313592.1 DUF5686 family protein [Lutibacter sp.]
MKYFLFSFFTLFIIFSAISQNYIQGIILDEKTLKPLPFASIITNTNFGTLTDIDGKFNIKTINPFHTITISYVGYTKVKKELNPKIRYLKIYLSPSIETLNEVVISSKKNPAIDIIQKVILNKSKNNIEEALNSFKFNTYNKILVTANPDSISGIIDTLFSIKNGEKKFDKLDSTNFKFKKEIEHYHLYISEKISEFQFQKGKKTKELILASRMAGLKQPIYEFLAITFQDFSFYNELYTIAGTQYTNPIATNALKNYNYKILDTVDINNRPTYLIYYKPKEKKEFIGIEGVLYIDTSTFGIAHAIAELKGIVNVKATQNYKFLPEQPIWFPAEMDIVLKKGNTKENIKLFGGTIKFSQSEKKDSLMVLSKNKPEDITYFISKSVNSNVVINPIIEIKKSATTILFTDDAATKSEEFWDKYRTEPITERGLNTYIKIDSIAYSEGIERKINIGRNLLKGYFPTKYINLNLGKIINLNNYEGLRVGIGGITNHNFSPIVKVESYIAFGTKDKDFKYSFGTSFRIEKKNNMWIGANATNDIKEAASIDFIASNSTFSPINPRNLNISKFYNYKTISSFIEIDIQPNLEAKLQVSTGEYTPVFEYQFVSNTRNLTSFNLTTATVGVQYNPKNEYMNSPEGKLTIKNNFPQITFQTTKSIENIFSGDFDFTQFSVQILHKIKPLRKAITHVLLEGGIVFGDAPITHLFNATPNYTFKNPWAKRITFAGKNSFETMGYNEFISDRFIAIHFKHEFKAFIISPKFKPQLTIANRAAIGAINNANYHQGLEFKSLNKGYLESGFEINRLLKGFGLSAYYRFGSYQNPEWSDNLAVKLTYKLNLGF